MVRIIFSHLTIFPLTQTYCSFETVSLTMTIPPVAKQSKQKSMGKAVKTPSLNWMEPLPPPPPSSELEHCADDEDEHIEDMW